MQLSEIHGAGRVKESLKWTFTEVFKLISCETIFSHDIGRKY